MKQLAIYIIAGLSWTPVCAQDGELTMALGGFDVGRAASTMGQVEYQFAANWSGFRPKVGLFATSDSAAYLYGGVGYPLALSDKWMLTPSVSVGYYNDGADTDLGYDVEFYTQIRLDYQLADDAKVGLGIGHISNLELGDDNPGAETAYLSYSIAF